MARREVNVYKGDGSGEDELNVNRFTTKPERPAGKKEYYSSPDTKDENGYCKYRGNLSGGGHPNAAKG